MKSISWGNFEGEQISKARCTRVPIRLFFLLLGPNESQRFYNIKTCWIKTTLQEAIGQCSKVFVVFRLDSFLQIFG